MSLERPIARATWKLPVADREGKIAITLVGNFLVKDGDRVLTPRGARAKALIAILARTDDMRRSRRWIEAQLWSDRDANQSSASLRQVLVEVRRAFGDLSHILKSDREHVWLDKERVEIDLIDRKEEALNAHLRGRDFLEDLTIRDEAFEDWLRQEARAIERDLTTKARSATPDHSCLLALKVRGELAPEQRTIAELCYQMLTGCFGDAVDFRTIDTSQQNVSTDNASCSPR